MGFCQERGQAVQKRTELQLERALRLSTQEQEEKNGLPGWMAYGQTTQTESHGMGPRSSSPDRSQQCWAPRRMPQRRSGVPDTHTAHLLVLGSSLSLGDSHGTRACTHMHFAPCVPRPKGTIRIPALLPLRHTSLSSISLIFPHLCFLTFL